MVRTLELIEYARVNPAVRFDSILLAEPVVNPLTMDIVYGICNWFFNFGGFALYHN